ncbi:PilZ domain-containing protein [Ornithinibacillus contaminans]|uniref:PilZ domain-containing protein n=1 Tax=Ornithinibacillus contaminans TaxID=694055 RepID=UPI00069CE2DD|nr:PilZ domain-containing protein [Ornithinibacillus contaminans]
MRYRRDEAFRFEFEEPVPITFTIDELNGKPVQTSDGDAKLLDISLRGMKIRTSLLLPVSKQHVVKLTTHFQLNNHEYAIRGILVWKKQRLSDCYYGIQFLTNAEFKKDLLDDLKLIGKRLV